jgi:hypothetical protein
MWSQARSCITHSFRHAILKGSLLLEEGSAREVIGLGTTKSNAELFVRDETFWLRLYLKGDLGCKLSSSLCSISICH